MIRIGICGYGNVGSALEQIIKLHKDMKLMVIFSRRNIKANSNIKVVNTKNILEWKKLLDVLILANGSKKDLPTEGPLVAQYFNTVDSYDNHSNMLNYYEAMDKASKKGKKLSIIAAGWDPGKFSKERIEASAYYPDGKIKTFWGDGISEGHTNAIKEFNKMFNKNWIIDAIQYTHPIINAIRLAKEGKADNLTLREQHSRECFIAVTDDANKDFIINWITKMPHYYDEYDTIIKFVSKEEIKEKEKEMNHKGLVIAYGLSIDNNPQLQEYKLDLSSNPEHTARILIAYARSNYRLNKEGKIGSIPSICVPVDKLHPDSLKTLIKTLV